jgi:hypothetical protein
MDEKTQDKLKAVVETLLKKEAGKFRSLIQKELDTKVQAKMGEMKKSLSGSAATGKTAAPKVVKEVGGAMAPSAPPATTPSSGNSVPPPAPVKPLATKDIKIAPTSGASGEQTLDPNFEKEFFTKSYLYKGQKVVVKTVGTGFGKPVRIYINDKSWEFFPGPNAASSATKAYIDGMMKDAKQDPELARAMTDTVIGDKKKAGQPPAPTAKPKWGGR